MIMKTLLAGSVSSLMVLGAAQAATMGVLMADGSMAIVDTGTKKVTKTKKVTATSGPLVGVDVRPADGMLYGLTADGTVYTIAMDGVATRKSKLEAMPPAGGITTVDFNPAADRLRVIGSDGTNLRANVDDGKVIKDGALKYADAGKKHKVVAGAYTNSVKGTKETALFDIDAESGALVKQAPPDDDALTAVGMLGAKFQTIAFDIWSDGTKNDAWALADGQLWSIDLATGKATAMGKIEGLTGGVKDIAILSN